MMLPGAVTAALETAINQYLALDPETLARLKTLEGRVVCIELKGLNVRFYLLPGGDGLQVLSHYEGEPDTLLRGGLFAMAGMSLGADKEKALFSGDVEIRGDTELGQQFEDALQSMDVDWEEHLSRVIGDVAAHKAGNLARDARDYAGKSASTLTDDVSEYLQEEARLLPARIQLENFLNDVDQLRMDVDRLQARVQRLLDAAEGSRDQAAT